MYTDQNSIYRTSETISPTAIPNETVEETWAEMKYRLGAEAATEAAPCAACT